MILGYLAVQVVSLKLYGFLLCFLVRIPGIEPENELKPENELHWKLQVVDIFFVIGCRCKPIVSL